MAQPTLTWGASPSGDVTQYSITWTQNGTALPPVIVPQDPTSDASGYNSPISAVSPAPTLNPGDTIGASIIATDTVSGLSSSPVTPGAVVIPVVPVPPQPPQNVALAIV